MAVGGSNAMAAQPNSEAATTAAAAATSSPAAKSDVAKPRSILPRVFLVICAFFVIMGSESFFSISRPSAHTIGAHTTAKEEPHQSSTTTVRRPQPSSNSTMAGTTPQVTETTTAAADKDTPKAVLTPPSNLDTSAIPADARSSDTKPVGAVASTSDIAVPDELVLPVATTSITTGNAIPLVADPADVKLAKAFVMDRKDVYHQADLDYRWKLRGIGYLYHIHNVVLLASLPAGMGPSGTIEISPETPNKQTIIIRNVNEESASTFECEKMTIWVRVAGPEIFADAAVAVRDDPNAKTCHWKFDFDLRVPGSYKVDIKVLLWNGEAKITGDDPLTQCNYTKGPMPNATLATYKHDGFLGFKMYHALSMCCEICTRTPHCKAWATPFMRLNETWMGRNGCELMFESDAPADALPVSSLWPPPKQKRQRQRSLAEVEKFHGVAHTNPTSYFCGCGWSFWFTLDFPCLSADLDDRVFMTKSEFVAKVATTTTEPKAPLQLPVCTLQHERIAEPTNGRWVRDSWPNSTVCPFPYELGKLASKSFPLTKFDDLYPSCWNREDISRVGSDCIEMNCALIDKTTEWHSHLHKDKEFYGVWRPYDCHYVQYTTPQLQECVTKRKIVKFEKSGFSIAEFLSEFVNHRLANITMYPEPSDPNALTVVYDTLGLLHKSGPNVLEEAVASLPVVPASEERYWISSFFLSSERETHAHYSRMLTFNRYLVKILEAKKYKMINAFDMTAAFTYDSATQMDGMHIVGPPMKTAITKLFHHVCKDVVDGSPL